jgi:hypothetical protein
MFGILLEGCRGRARLRAGRPRHEGDMRTSCRVSVRTAEAAKDIHSSLPSAAQRPVHLDHGLLVLRESPARRQGPHDCVTFCQGA